MVKRGVILLIAGVLLSGCDVLGLFGDDSPEGGEMAWWHDHDLGVYTAMPALSSTTAFVASDGHVRALDLTTGELQWKTERLIGGNRPRIRSRKLLREEGTLYSNHLSNVWAIDAETGEVLWYTRISDFIDIDFAKMAQNDSHLFLGGRGEVVRLRKSDGAVDLRIELDRLLHPEAERQSGMDPELLGNDTLFVPAGFFFDGAEEIYGNVFAYDAHSGELIWEFDVPQKRRPIPGREDSLTIGAGVLGLDVNEDYVVFPYGESVMALDRHTGEPVWDTFFPAEHGFDLGLTIAGGRVFVGSLQSAMLALDLHTGERLWQTRSPGSITTIVTARDGRVYFTNAAGGSIWVLDAATGDVIWREDAPREIGGRHDTFIGPMAVGEEVLVVPGSQRIFGYWKP